MNEEEKQELFDTYENTLQNRDIEPSEAAQIKNQMKELSMRMSQDSEAPSPVSLSASIKSERKEEEEEEKEDEY